MGYQFRGISKTNIWHLQAKFINDTCFNCLCDVIQWMRICSDDTGNRTLKDLNDASSYFSAKILIMVEWQIIHTLHVIWNMDTNIRFSKMLEWLRLVLYFCWLSCPINHFKVLYKLLFDAAPNWIDPLVSSQIRWQLRLTQYKQTPGSLSAHPAPCKCYHYVYSDLDSTRIICCLFKGFVIITQVLIEQTSGIQRANFMCSNTLYRETWTASYTWLSLWQHTLIHLWKQHTCTV